MSFDHLLLWLSAKGEGSWAQFRAAVEALHIDAVENAIDSDDGEHQQLINSDLPIYQHARFSLERLGHAEFSAAETGQRWKIVPPTIALCPGPKYKGVLCGIRTPLLLETLDSLCDVEILKESRPEAPMRILMRSDNVCTINTVARQLGCLIQPDAPAAILSALPKVRNEASWFPSTIPETTGWKVHKFSPSRLGWKESTGTEAISAITGLFRFFMKHQRFYYLRWKGQTYSVPVQVGKYALMRNQRQHLFYDAETKCFSVPVIFRPPLLIERALVLCSGFLPHIDQTTRRLVYNDVPSDIANLSAQLLHQRIR